MPINREQFSNGKKHLKKNAFVEWTYEEHNGGGFLGATKNSP